MPRPAQLRCPVAAPDIAKEQGLESDHPPICSQYAPASQLIAFGCLASQYCLANIRSTPLGFTFIITMITERLESGNVRMASRPRINHMSSNA